MKHEREMTYVVVAAIVAATSELFAQAPHHQHYERTEAARQPGPGGVLAPRLQNLGTHTFKVTTRSSRAQQFINQGMNLTYGFNHAEAGRAFAEAARLDPDLRDGVLGPGAGARSQHQRGDARRTTSRRRSSWCRRRCRRAGRHDRASATTSMRSRSAIPARRKIGSAADRAFADAMRAVTKKYPSRSRRGRPSSPKSLMDLRPWNYWTRDGLPQEGTPEAVAALERVLAANPKHPGALHYWIHLWEPTKNPERAEQEADRLLPLMPGAGHIIHMPAHILPARRALRRRRHVEPAGGRRRRGLHRAVPRAGHVSARLLPAQHPFHLDRRDDVGSERVWPSSRRARSRRQCTRRRREPAVLQGFLVVPYCAMVRFGQWDEILAEPTPAHDTIFTRGVWHYARGAALAGKGQPRRSPTRNWRRCRRLPPTRRCRSCRRRLAQYAGYHPADRARSADRRPRRPAQAVRRGDRASRSRRAARGCA